MRILVTGANGFIGSVVVRKLIVADWVVRCLVRKASKTSRIDDLRFERAEGDVRDPSAVQAAVANCSAVIHLASIANWSDLSSREMDDVVVGGTKNVLKAAHSAGCSRVVYVSSSLAVCGSNKPQLFDENSRRPARLDRLQYARAKAEAESLCRQAGSEGLEVVVVNPGEVYGPNDITLVTAGNLIDFGKNSPVLVCGGGTAVVHVDDVAEGILAALDRGRPGERYILGGENLTVRQIAELTLEILGQKKTIIPLPTWFVRGLAWLGRNLGIPLPFNPEVIPYATKYWFMDNTKARHELGVEFRSARETLRPAVLWLQERGYIK